jgi:hypothetical protein
VRAATEFSASVRGGSAGIAPVESVIVEIAAVDDDAAVDVGKDAIDLYVSYRTVRCLHRHSPPAPPMAALSHGFGGEPPADMLSQVVNGEPPATFPRVNALDTRLFSST